MSPARVGVIGAGMAGPVLAMYLKLKGYDPVIYERTDSISEWSGNWYSAKRSSGPLGDPRAIRTRQRPTN